MTTLSDETNIKIIAFLYLFGGLVGMMNISGGIKGFSEWVGTKIKTERGLLGLIWLTLPFTFMMPMFRIMMIGPVVKSLAKKNERLQAKGRADDGYFDRVGHCPFTRCNGICWFHGFFSGGQY